MSPTIKELELALIGNILRNAVKRHHKETKCKGEHGDLSYDNDWIVFTCRTCKKEVTRISKPQTNFGGDM